MMSMRAWRHASECQGCNAVGFRGLGRCNAEGPAGSVLAGARWLTLVGEQAKCACRCMCGIHAVDPVAKRLAEQQRYNHKLEGGEDDVNAGMAPRK